MAFLPYKDYFGLSKVVWNSLDQVSRPPVCRVNGDALGITSELLFADQDPLDQLRTFDHADFSRNGVEVALDEVDVFQSRIREQTDAECSSNPASQTIKKQSSQCRKKKKACVFCRNNGEASSVYQSHVLKDDKGRTTCPILRRYTCPTCGASGDKAHTIRYCPLYDGGLTAALSARLSAL